MHFHKITKVAQKSVPLAVAVRENFIFQQTIYSVIRLGST